MAGKDPHNWKHITSSHSGVMGDVSIDYAWCLDCGALKKQPDWGGPVTIETPTEYHTCGTDKSKKPVPAQTLSDHEFVESSFLSDVCRRCGKSKGAHQ